MDAEAIDYRQQRGQAIVQTKGKKIRQIVDTKYLVPSQTLNGGTYVVDAMASTCTCPDFETNGPDHRCKHLWAVLIVRREVTAEDGTTVVTEQEVRISYPQNWPAYNRAQMEEKSRIEILLKGLCEGIVQPSQTNGRPRLPLADVVYGATMKVYTTFSGRRATTDIKACEERGFVEKAPHYNSLFRYLERADMQPLLTTLVEESAAPLKAIETNFAVDGTGFSTNTYASWFDHKYGEEKRSQRWIKAHAMIGVKTNVITAVKMTEGFVNDAPQLPSLVTATAAKGFTIQEVSADKAYLSHDNLAAVEAAGGVPYVPFKSNSKGTGSAAWQRLWHVYSLNREDFLAHYHQRSNVESTFSAVKRKFGGSLRSKLPAAQYNEGLLKCLCFNLTVLVHSIHELGIDPKFWMPRTEQPS
jgi:transposase